MLHAPTSATKTDTVQSKTHVAPKPERELHPQMFGVVRLQVSGSAMPGSSPDAQRRQTVAGMQSTHGNQAVLRMLCSPQQIFRKLASRPSQSVMLQRKCACGGSSESSGECAECKAKREGTLQRRTANVSPAAANGVPPIVHDVLSSPGQPLDAGTRAFMEPRFGHDFSLVRLHTDSRAAEAAQAVQARAFTLGQDVVLGAGESSLSSTQGQHLIAHELVHTIQQRTNNPDLLKWKRGVSMPTDAAEVEADAIATAVVSTDVVEEAPLPIRTSFQQEQIHRQEKPGGESRTRPLSYVSGRQVIPPAEGLTEDTLKADLRQRGLKDDIKVEGAKDAAERIVVLNALYQYANHENWGNEIHTISPMKSGADAPLGQLILEIDTDGRAVAKLVKVGVVKTKSVRTFASVQEAEAALTKEFKLSGKFEVTKEYHYRDMKPPKKETAKKEAAKSAPEQGESLPEWTLPYLNKVHVALSLLSEKKERRALEGATLSLVGKLFIDNDEFDGLTESNPLKIYLAKRAFEKDDFSFVTIPESRIAPESVQTILHEAGHAIDDKTIHDAVSRFNQSLQASIEADNAFVNEYNRRRPGTTVDTPEGAYLVAAKQLGDALYFLQKNPDLNEHKKLKKTANTLHDTMPSPVPEALKRMLQLQDAWFNAVMKQATNFVRMEEARNPGKRLESFIKVVKEHFVVKDDKGEHLQGLNQYAKDNWPKHPQEAFAVAYSLWHTDRGYLEANMKQLFDWFDKWEQE